jgi:signal peptidase I
MKDWTQIPSKPRPHRGTQIPGPLRVIEVDVEYPVRYGKPAPRSWLRRVWNTFWPWTCFVACCLLSYYLVSEYIVTTVVVQGRSMAPTLTDGDRYLLHRWQLLFREPARGDLVVIRDAVRNDFVVKRIVGLPRERIQFKDGEVFVNGSKLVESYLTHGTTTHVLGGVEPLFLVGADRYFVMGDNRDVSEDSRIYGAIRGSQILGFIPRQ